MNIDWFTFLAQVINFAVLVYLLQRFLYEPINRTMNDREQMIASRLLQAEDIQQNAKLEADRYRDLSANLEQQRHELFQQARVESEAARKTLIADARAEIQSRREEWIESLHREQQTLINLVRQKASKQIVEVSRGALSQLADAKLEELTLANFLKQLDQLADSDNHQLIKESVGQVAHVHTAFSIADSGKQRIREKLGEMFQLTQINFVTSPDLVCGVELHIGGNKIGWSVQEYLESLTDELQGMLG